MVVVGRAILGVGRHVDQVRSFDEAQIVDFEHDLCFAIETPGHVILDVGVGAVDRRAIDGEKADAEHEIVDGLGCAYTKDHAQPLPRNENVPFSARGVAKLDGGDLDLPASPAALPIARRPLLGRRSLAGVLRPRRPRPASGRKGLPLHPRRR